MTASNLKRPRSPEADCEECLPISKRINSLQIESGQQSFSLDNNGSVNNNVPADRPNGNVHPENIITQCRKLRINSDPASPDRLRNVVYPSSSRYHSARSASINDMNCSGHSNRLPYNMEEGYNPELEEKDNPIYFHINEVLFRAHKERAERLLIKFPD